MREQVVSWQESEVWETFSSGMQRLYMLLGGMTSGHDDSASEKSWLHDFAIEFWYSQVRLRLFHDFQEFLNFRCFKYYVW